MSAAINAIVGFFNPTATARQRADASLARIRAASAEADAMVATARASRLEAECVIGAQLNDMSAMLRQCV